MAERLVNQEDTNEPANEERISAREAKEGILEEKFGPGSLSWLLGLGLSLLPSNHLDLSPRWQQWFLRFLIFQSCEENSVQLFLPQGPIRSSLDVLFLHHRLYGTHWPLCPNQHCPSKKKIAEEINLNPKNSGGLLPWSDELRPCYNRSGRDENMVSI